MTTRRRALSFLLPLLGLVLWSGTAWAAGGSQPKLVDSGSRFLTLITFMPIVAVPFLLLPWVRGAAVKWISLVFSGIPLLLTGYVLTQFRTDWNVGKSATEELTGYLGAYGLQFVEHVTWIETFNIEYFMAVDGLSITMVLLTALISVLCIVASWGIDKQIKGYFSLFLLLQTGMTGLFCALDFFLFFVFWEVMLLPMYFLIGVWGAPPRVDAQGRTRGGPYSAIKFFLYTMAGSVLMLLGIIALYYHSGPSVLASGKAAAHTFNIMYLIYENSFSGMTLLGLDLQRVVWVGFFICFAIKVPMFPFHTWLPDAHVDAPTPISVILAGVLLKMGTYGMMRINWPMLPEATFWAIDVVAAFGMINIVYGALAAMGQHRAEGCDLKKLIAYSSVSHMGFCLLGMAAMNDVGMNGALLQMFNHGTITAQLFLLVGVVYDRAHHRRMDGFGGLAKVMPVYTAFVGVAWFAALGLPGLSGFISEALTFIGAFQHQQLFTIVSATSVVLTAGYMLWSLQRIWLGKLNEKYKDIKDISLREVISLAPLVVTVIVLGFYPKLILGFMEAGLKDVVAPVARFLGH